MDLPKEKRRKRAVNNVLHMTAIRWRSIAAGELDR